jgi:hypothetical protein
MARTVAIILGAVFILLGLAGFLSNNLLGAHLTTAHNIIHLVSGAVALYIGLRGSMQAAKLFCYAFGAVYLLLGVVGYWMGGMHQTTNLPASAQDAGVNENMFRLIPGVLELGTVDHLLHVLIGLVFIISAVLTRGDMTKYTEGSPG